MCWLIAKSEHLEPTSDTIKLREEETGSPTPRGFCFLMLAHNFKTKVLPSKSLYFTVKKKKRKKNVEKILHIFMNWM